MTAVGSTIRNATLCIGRPRRRGGRTCRFLCDATLLHGSVAWLPDRGGVGAGLSPEAWDPPCRVRTQYGYNRIQVCGAGTGAQWQVPLGSFCYLSPLCHRPASADLRAAVMDCAKEDAAYEMPLTSKRPYKFWPFRPIGPWPNRGAVSKR